MADTSNPYDSLVNLAPSNNTTPSINPYDDIVGQQNAVQEEQLNLVLRQASTIDPVNQAEVQRISRETGIPQDLVGRNQEEILREWGARRARTAEIARNNPIVARQLADRDFASIAWDDIPNLTNTEALVNFFRELPEDAAAGYRRGVNTNEMGYIGHRAKIGTANEEDMARFRELQAIDRETGRLGFVGNFTTLFGQMLDSQVDPIITGATTGLGYAGAVAIAGQLGPQVAVPEEIVTVPVGFGTGFYAGYMAKNAEQAYRIEAGHSYMDMIEAGVDRSVAQYASTGVGLTNAALNFVGLSMVASPIKSALTRVMTERVAANLTRPGMRAAMTAFGVNYTRALVGETTTEVAQELVTLFGTEVAKSFADGEFEYLLDTPEGRQQIADTVVETMRVVGQGMSIMALPGASLNLTMDIRAARQAKRDQHFIQDLGFLADQSQVQSRNPDAYQQFIQAQTNGTPVENIYIDGVQLEAVLRQQGITPEQFDQVVPGGAEQLLEAVATGGDVIIPTGTYAAKLAGTNAGAAMTEHLRVSVDGMSAKEAIEFQGKQQEMMAEAKATLEQNMETNKEFNAQAATVRKTIVDMVKQTGQYSEKVAATYGDFVRDFVVVNAAKLNMSPQAFYERYMYRITGQMQGQQAMQDQDILASEGFVNQATNEVIPTSKPFQDWFGASTLVDEQGAPKVVYHGTVDSIDAFDLDHPNRKDSGWLGTGVYLTDSSLMGGMYANQKARSMSPKGQQVMPLYARLENPYYATAEEKQQIRQGGRQAADEFTARLKEMGHDGVILQVAPDAQEIVVFEPSAVKSVFNDGTWSRETSQILSQQAGQVTTGQGRIATNTPAFENWFGDSQVVDANGKPLVVYHGTDVGTDFVSFDTTDMGSWFAVNPYTAQPYTEREGNGSGRIIPAYLSIKNPLRIPEDIDLSNEATVQESLDRINDDNGTTFDAVELGLDPEYQGNAFEWLGGWEPQVIQAFKDAGFDGISAYEIGEITWAAFEPTQIKSVFNNGEFSTSDANILRQRARPTVKGEAAEQGNKHGLMPHLRVDTGIEIEDGKKPLFTQKTNNKNAPAQIAALDEIASRHPNPGQSIEAWNAMMSDALASSDLPVPPYNFIKSINGTGSFKLLSKLSEGQLDDANHGFENAAWFREQYTSGNVSVADTGKLFLWSFLSRGVSPYAQEGMFIDAFAGIDEWIAAAADGTLPGRMDEYLAWAATAAPQGSGQPGAGTAHNLNAFGTMFLQRMSEDSGDGTGRSRLQVIHDMMSDPNATGREIRRVFLAQGEGVGIDNKVVSFTLLVAGFQDVMVLDRVQIRELWNDGRFDGINLYDGYKDGGAGAVSGSSYAQMTMGARGLLLYEAIENTLQNKIVALYKKLGRPQDASIGRYHWETWVASSNQEASHGTIDAILAGVKGNQRPLQGVTAKEGEYGAYAYGARYGRDGEGQPYFLYSVPGASDYKFTVDQFRKFLREIKKASNGVVPSKFKVSESGNQPWYLRPEVNLGKLDELSSTLGEKYEPDSLSTDDATAGIDQPISNRLAADQSGTLAQQSRGQQSGAARDRRGFDPSGNLAPLEGAPIVNGATGPDPTVVAVAERYAAANGIELRRQSEYATINPELAAAISQAYANMPHDPTNPVVVEAYQNLIQQTIAQYQALVDAGYEFQFYDETNDPYAGNPMNAMRDLRENMRMGVFATDGGFGSAATQTDSVENNPMLADTGITWLFNGEPKPVLANDLFRAVHDVFGHSMEGAGFRARGEENAWQAHVRLYTGSAVAAITSETRGQNSWLNYGPYGEQNATANVLDTIFAEQKTGLMPEWTWTEGRVGDAPTIEEALRQQSEQASAEQAQARGAQFEQPARGAFNPSKLTTMINQGADYSTFLHETAHFFLTVYADMATLPEATPQMKQDMQTILDFFDVKDIETWNAMSLEEQRKYHEAFAYNYEIYLFEGKAPNTAMQGMFTKFTRWLTQVYKSIRDELNALYRQENGTDLPILTDEIRSVMDRMVASEEQITQAEAVRNMQPMFQTQEQSGMDDATWAAYQEMIEEAHDAAVIDLQRASVRQVKWLNNARSRLIKALQKEAETTRKATRAAVSEEVLNEPIYRVMEFIKRGMIDGKPSEFSGKLSILEIEAMYGKGEMLDSIRKTFGYGKYGMLGKENGMHPEQVAEMFGFPSGYALVQALLNVRPMKEEIDLRTDKRMMEENADMMDQKSIDAKVEEALHNEARARFIGAELRFMTKATTPVRVMTAAAKQVAQQILGEKTIKSIKPHEFTQAEARASKAANKASKDGDPKAAAKAKQNQLVQNQLAKEALASKQEVAKALEFFRKVFKADKSLAKSRNMDLINAARAILAAYNLGKSDVAPAQYIEKIKAYDPDLYTQLEPLIIDASSGGKPYQLMTMNEFRSMRDMIEALWFQAKREKQIMIDGQAMQLDQVVTELKTRLDEIGLPETQPGELEAASATERLARGFNTGKALLRRVEHWANATDGAAGTGAFTKYIWRPVRDAISQYRTQRNEFVKRYAELVGKLELPAMKLTSNELGYTFGSANGGLGKAELLGAMLHTGNPSNYRKLLLGGRGPGKAWGKLNEDGTLDTSSWDAFIDRMISEGILTKADFDFLQAVWDLNEEMKPIAQKAHKDIFGYYFNEVEAQPVNTPFGVYRGGYVPAKVDPFLVGDATRNQKMEELEADFRQSMPSTGMGFTKSRVDYNKPLDLDVRKMTAHIDSVLRFAYIQPAIKDVLKILKNKDFSDTLNAIDPGAIEHMLLPWLNRAARQQTSTPGMYKGMDRFWQGVRNRTGISIMFANISNALQQITGYFPALLLVNKTYVKSAMWDYMKRPHQTADEVAALSPFMADRMNNQIFDIQETLNDLLLNPSKYQKVAKWTQKHGYFLQQAFQNQVDVVVWTATYNQTLAELGADVSNAKAQKEAVAKADANVRLSQDSLAAEDIAAFQVGSPFYKTLIQFTGYFNMLANLNASEYTKIFRDLGWRGNKGKLFMTYLLGFGLPMLMADAIVRTLGGEWEDEDDDGYIDEFAEWFFGSQLRGAVAMVPFGSSLLVPLNSLNDKPYDDRMSTSPSVSTLEAIAVGLPRTVINIVDEDREVTGKNVRDVLTALSIATGIPFTVFGRPAGYAIDVERGVIDPTSEVDYIRGLVTGKASEGTR